MLRILSYTIFDHPVIGDVEFDLCNKDENETYNYYSIIIGPNGTGKSYLLSTLINSFNEIKQLISNKKYNAKTKFSIEYQINGINYYVSTKESPITVKINNIGDKNIDDIVLPTKWLASSVTINDKFPILTDNSINKTPEYKYLGIRSASNNAFIKTITKKSMLYFVDALRKTKLDKLKKLYIGLQLHPSVNIEFKMGKMLRFDKSVDYSDLEEATLSLFEPHRNFLSNQGYNKSFRADTYKKYIENSDLLIRIAQFIVYKLNLKYRFDKNTPIIYDANFDTYHGINLLLEEWDLVLIALDLELLDLKKFTIIKDSGFSYEEASSGESHLLTSLHGILANLEDNSLLVIDEPEISLHPNWQIDYIDILKTIVDGYSGVNTIIATHSHFLVSGIKDNESRILSLRRSYKNAYNPDYYDELDNKKLVVEELDFATYGWSAEDILYNVFGVVSTRNKFVAEDIANVLNQLSNGEKLETNMLSNEIYNKIRTLHEALKENDPLKKVVNSILNRISDGNTSKL